MALVVTRGYLIKRSDYNYFDEILTFLNEHGNIFHMYAPGTKRITSKNARSLFFGNYLEFEFFHATQVNKMGKLKKVVAIHRIDYRYDNNLALLALNYLVSLSDTTSKNIYNFYQKILSYIISDYDPYALTIYLMVKYAQQEGLVFHFDDCVHCRNNKRIVSFDQNHLGLICVNCFEREPQFVLQQDLIKLFRYFAYAEDFDKNLAILEKNAVNLMKYLNHLLLNKLGVYIPYIDHLKK
ncbi:DNA repair protein RecO [Ureaplasma sp. ES3154-GEN]|uniref:DNA repair protein RecO n=1 Tax=Ureaplasma sp. ES3154-GEN TaxID=2984844 RepID=UPI0021E72B90|nr:DNA repair protein RecO [Ureaplasma sp. ES3154-GEN]MCV3743688.1 DNA repair protein RecO [Ureaplasma sp. ES3154-GEN]